MQRELRQQRPFRSPSVEAGAALLRCADRLRYHLDSSLQPFELTFQQYNVLRILRGAGADGLPTLEIGARLIERSPGITRLIDRLEKKGLVNRKHDSNDRRMVLCSITRRGVNMLAALDEPINARDEWAMSALHPPQLIALIRLLERLLSGLSCDWPDSPQPG